MSTSFSNSNRSSIFQPAIDNYEETAKTALLLTAVANLHVRTCMRATLFRLAPLFNIQQRFMYSGSVLCAGPHKTMVALARPTRPQT